MTFARARAELDRLTVRAVRPGLARTRVLLSALNQPDRAVPAVQITGTNGKGSVAALLASALGAAGYRVGRYTSPHLIQDRERVEIAGQMLTTRQFTRAFEALLPGLKQLHRAGDPATTFEAWTVLACEAFREAGVDLAVVEVGMGGRLDATTAWSRRILAVLTQVTLEHMQELGADRKAILKEKIAIGQPGMPMVTAEPDAELRAMIRAQASKIKFPVWFAGLPGDRAWVPAWRRTPRGIVVDLTLGPRTLPQADVALRGQFQVANAALAALALQVLGEQGFPVSENQLRAGFTSVVWPGRMELVRQTPPVFLDGAHNPAAVHALVQELLATTGPVFLIAGVMADKDVAQITRLLAPITRRVWTVTPPDARGLPAADLATWFQTAGVAAEPMKTYSQALETAILAAGRSGTVVVAGSLYNIAPAKKALAKIPPAPKAPR